MKDDMYLQKYYCDIHYTLFHNELFNLFIKYLEEE